MAKTVERVLTGITGFDEITNGGLPEARCTLVAGTSGTCKTVFGIQYLVAGIQDFNENGVIVTFEEPPLELSRNVMGFNWDLDGMQAEGKLAFVDATPDPEQKVVEAGDFDLVALLARIESAVKRVNAKRILVDAIGSLVNQFRDPQLIRHELYRIVSALRRMGITTVMNVERTEEDGPVARYGVEEFVADNVIIFRNRLEQEKRRRTVEVLKFRGASHSKGEYPFTIDPTEGTIIVPLSGVTLTQKSSEVRTSSGNPELDQMCGNGIFQDSIILVSGATGTGKTLMGTEFMKGAIERKERGMLFAFEESREQLFRHAASWGIDFAQAEADGYLKVISRYPESMGLDDHLIRIKRDIETFKPNRVAIDSVSALERVGSLKAFREFIIGITGHLKHEEVAGLLMNTTSMFMGLESITETHISSITDAIILLRYVELQGEMRRGIAVLKMRGSWHEKQIREFTIDHEGMHIREQFVGVNGILTGSPTSIHGFEQQRLTAMFEPPTT